MTTRQGNGSIVPAMLREFFLNIEFRKNDLRLLLFICHDIRSPSMKITMENVMHG
jgi:hypothetical protein